MKRPHRLVNFKIALQIHDTYVALDYATDVAIQKTLRTEFSRDTTIVTIAHRLQTIIDYDKIVRVHILPLFLVC